MVKSESSSLGVTKGINTLYDAIKSLNVDFGLGYSGDVTVFSFTSFSAGMSSGATIGTLSSESCPSPSPAVGFSKITGGSGSGIEASSSGSSASYCSFNSAGVGGGGVEGVVEVGSVVSGSEGSSVVGVSVVSGLVVSGSDVSVLTGTTT